ncbi:hypothetical protein BGZ94_008628, partial [Podila epigama]
MLEPLPHQTDQWYEERVAARNASIPTSTTAAGTPVTSTDISSEVGTKRKAEDISPRGTHHQSVPGSTVVQGVTHTRRSVSTRSATASQKASKPTAVAMPNKPSAVTSIRHPIKGATKGSLSCLTTATERDDLSQVATKPEPKSTITSLTYEARHTALTNLLNQFSLCNNKKRPAWDTRGRLEEMDELMSAVYQYTYQESKSAQRQDAVDNDEDGVTATINSNTTSLWGGPRQLKRPARDTKLHVQESTKIIDIIHQKLRKIYQASKELENIEMSGKSYREQQELVLCALASKETGNDNLVSRKNSIDLQAQRTEDLVRQRELTIASLEENARELFASHSELNHRLDVDEQTRRRLEDTIANIVGHAQVL